MSFWLVSYWRYVPQISLILEAELTHAPLDVFSHHFSHKAHTHIHTLRTHISIHTHTHINTHRPLYSQGYINRYTHKHKNLDIPTLLLKRGERQFCSCGV